VIDRWESPFGTTQGYSSSLSESLHEACDPLKSSEPHLDHLLVW